MVILQAGIVNTRLAVLTTLAGIVKLFTLVLAAHRPVTRFR